MFEPMQLAPGFQLANAEKDGAAYAASVGATSLKALRALPAASLLAGKRDAVTHPVIEPYVLPSSPYDVFAAGRQNDVALLVGSNADEARSLVDDLASVTAASFDADITRRWGALPPQLLSPYPHKTDAEAIRARLDFERDLRFGWDVWAWARLEAITGRNSVFYYHFTHTPPFPAGSVYAGWGPSHFAELWYTSDHLDQAPWPWTTDDRALAAAMTLYWTNFIKFGDPNGPHLTGWPRFEGPGGRVLYLGEPLTVGGVANLDTLSAFDAVYAQVRGAPFPGKPMPLAQTPLIVTRLSGDNLR
jgi:para-nitrobenzyl esterase